MYINLLHKIESEKKAYGLGIQPPANETELTDLKSKAQKSLQYQIEKEHEKFLRIMNGLSWNGFYIYASQISKINGFDDRYIDGFVDANLQYWDNESYRKFFVFGETGDALYVLNRKTKQFQEIDRVAIDPIKTFKHYDEMLYHILSRALE